MAGCLKAWKWSRKGCRGSKMFQKTVHTVNGWPLIKPYFLESSNSGNSFFYFGFLRGSQAILQNRAQCANFWPKSNSSSNNKDRKSTKQLNFFFFLFAIQYHKGAFINHGREGWRETYGNCHIEDFILNTFLTWGASINYRGRRGERGVSQMST